MISLKIEFYAEMTTSLVIAYNYECLTKNN